MQNEQPPQILVRPGRIDPGIGGICLLVRSRCHTNVHTNCSATDYPTTPNRPGQSDALW